MLFSFDGSEAESYLSLTIVLGVNDIRNLRPPEISNYNDVLGFY